MRVKCIDDKTMSGLFKELSLTKGEIYNVIEETNNSYTISFGSLNWKSYSKNKFIKVSD